MRLKKKELWKAMFYTKVVLIALIISGCYSKDQFDSHKWKEKEVDWWMTDVREKMVEDLIQSDTLRGLNQKQVIFLLGEPEAQNENEFKYLIREKYDYDIDPVYISRLIVEFDSNGYVNSCGIEF